MVGRSGRRTRAWALATALILATTLVVAAGQHSRTEAEAAPASSNSAAVASLGTLGAVAKLTGAADMWACGWTGKGVDIALIDTGVAPVPGIGNLLNGPDLSFDVQTGGPAYVDAYGHGTHLASIVNGRDPGITLPTGCRVNANGTIRPATDLALPTGVAGMAPDSRLINAKVGAVDGAVDATQVIAAIDWVVANRKSHGLNIRVITLAYGVDTSLPWRSDPLSHAVEVARRNGIVVVAAAGNDGNTKVDLASPALNQNIIAVGALDTMGSTKPSSWAVADFASRGNARRSPDVLAPGVSIEGLRVPGSVADLLNPGAVVGTRFIRGSGTSQAAAVASGLVALLLQRYPKATPAQVKAMLMAASVPIPGAKNFQGAGAIVADGLLKVAAASQAIDNGNTAGSGPINGDRADGTLQIDNVTLTGEVDVQGKAWSSVLWARTASQVGTWKGGMWQGTRWAGDGFGPAGWTVAKWPKSWSGKPWPTSVWSTNSWDFTGLRWRGTGWSGLRWRDANWSSLRWRGESWS
jgi:serine protease AprX